MYIRKSFNAISRNRKGRRGYLFLYSTDAANLTPFMTRLRMRPSIYLDTTDKKDNENRV
jgi:hypothetical protein